MTTIHQSNQLIEITGRNLSSTPGLGTAWARLGHGLARLGQAVKARAHPAKQIVGAVKNIIHAHARVHPAKLSGKTVDERAGTNYIKAVPHVRTDKGDVHKIISFYQPNTANGVRSGKLTIL